MVQMTPEEERVHLKIMANHIYYSTINAPAFQVADIDDP